MRFTQPIMQAIEMIVDLEIVLCISGIPSYEPGRSVRLNPRKLFRSQTIQAHSPVILMDTARFEKLRSFRLGLAKINLHFITVPTGCSALGYSAFSTKACAFQRNVACAISTPRATCFLKKYGRWAGSLKWSRISTDKRANSCIYFNSTEGN